MPGRGMRRGRRVHRRRRRRRVMLVGGLIAFGAYKLSKQDVQRVEEHTGRDAEELTDEELEQAMDQLGIEKQKVDDSDKEEGAQQDKGQAQGPNDYMEELEKLGELHDKGILTDEEFAAKKKEILAK